MQNLKKLLLVGLLLVGGFSLVAPLAPVALAGTTPCTSADGETWTYTWDDGAAKNDPGLKVCPPHNVSDFYSAISRIFSTAAGLIAVISGLFLLVAAFTYVTSKGDEEKVGKAKDTIIYAMIGLIVAGLAYGIPLVVRSVIF